MPKGMEWVIIILAIVLLFGGRKIPELMKGLGSGIREFKKASSGVEEDESKPSSEQKN
ncbi:MAG: twin-arginine translocase TatA/TatE family subunit [Ignavibacteria bacterium]|nr:twin-arginine translocase TatA/TatE family subunit [Ignavibacteria bacterium]